MKRILLLSDINSPHTQKWVTALLQRGMVVHVFSLSKPTKDWYKELSNFSFSFEDRAYAQRKGIKRVFKVFYLKGSSELKKVAEEFKPDFVHAHYASSYGLLGSFLNFSPYYVSVWGSDVFEFPKRSPLTKKIFKRVMKKANKIFSTGEVMAKEIQLYTTKKVEVVSFGIDTEKFQPSPKSEKAITVLGLIKTLEPIYGVDILLKAIALVHKELPPIELRIIGDGSQRQELEKLSSELGINHLVNFKGRIPYGDVPKEYQELDILVNPSRFESFGVSALEASACGVPVIASRAGGLTEVVVDGSTGLLVPPEQPNELGEAIKKLVLDKGLRVMLGANGREFVLKNYKIESSIDNMIKHYQ